MTDPNSTAAIEAPEPSRLAPLFPGYEIEHLIAVGGMGAVYKAVQLSLDRPVAIKILPREFGEDASFRANFEAEAKAMARLNHPNLIGVYDFGEVEGMLFIIMEFVLGKTLYHSAHGIAIAPEAAARIVVGVCQGLAHAHEHGILHRDIKPGNILLDQQARPKIGDFGLARRIGTAVHADETVFGTPHYTAPEVITHPALVDARADIYSVGVVLHELLTGRLPAVDARPPSTICDCDPRFDEIIRRATHPVPDLRYANAAEMARDLRAIATPIPPATAAKRHNSPATGARYGANPSGARPLTSPAGARPVVSRRHVATPANSSNNVVGLVLLGVGVVAILVVLIVQWSMTTSHPAAPPVKPSPPAETLTPKPPPAVDHAPSFQPKPAPDAAEMKPKPEPSPEPEVAKTDPVPPDPMPVTPAPAPVPTFDVPAFLDHARDVMRQKSAPVIATHDKEIEKNYDSFERQVIYKYHQIDKDNRGSIEAWLDKLLRKWRDNGKRVPKTLGFPPVKPSWGGGRGKGARGAVDQEKDFREKVGALHPRYLAKQVELDKKFEVNMLELAATYIRGLDLQIERLSDPAEAAAVAQLQEEIAATQAKPLYFTELMRGIDPTTKEPANDANPKAEGKPEAKPSEDPNGNATP